MSDAEVIDARRYPEQTRGSLAPIRWGIWGLIVVEATVFASLVASYFYLRLSFVEWPPAGVSPPELLLPTINTVVLSTSSFFVYKADSGLRRRGDQRWLKWGLGVGALLALTFLGIKSYEYSHVSYRWNSHAYGSIVWTITGFHSAHVLFLVMKTLAVELLALLGHFDRQRYVAVQVNGIYWHFVVIVWLPLYAVLYLSPRFL